jgi:hypothetical protein
MPKKTIVLIVRLTGSGRADGKGAGIAILVGFPRLTAIRCGVSPFSRIRAAGLKNE